MDRRAALVGIALVVAGATAWAKHVAHPSAPSTEKPGLALVAIDRGQRLIRVELHGIHKPPAGNLFSMTDDRGRHYIAQTVRCAPPVGTTWSCALEIPDGYERHPLVSLELHLRGLHSRTIAVPKEAVATAWQAALGPRPDGGSADPTP